MAPPPGTAKPLLGRNGNGPSVLPQVAGLSLLICAIAILGLGAQGLALRQRRFALTRGMPMRFALGAWRWPAAILGMLVLLIVLVLPAVALIATSLVPAYGVALSMATLTIDNYAEVLVRQASTARAFVNSSYLSMLAALILGLARLPRPLGRLAHGLLELPYALPGIVLAIACILLFLRPLPLLGSLYATHAGPTDRLINVRSPHL